MKWFKKKINSTSDEELLRKAQSGDQEALTLLFSRYIDLLYGLCLKYLSDPAMAEDTVMDIYEKLQQKIGKHQINTFRTWLYVLAKNHCLEHIRKKKKETDRKAHYLFVQSDDIFHPYEEDREDQFLKLEECLEKLSSEQRQMIKLFYLEQKSYKEISGSNNMSWDKVRSLIQNGRRNLKNCIEEK